MKKPESPEALLSYIKNMDHRERICFELSKEARQELGKNAHSLEIYVTFPFENAKLSDKDPFRVLFQYVTIDGKVNGLSKMSTKRSFIKLSLLKKLINQML